MPKKVIGPVEIGASYAVARDWLAGVMSRTDAVTKLHDDYGLNVASAGDMLQALKAIFHGETFTRSISAAAAEYFVSAIERDDGVDAAHKAIAAIEQHVAYYEGVQPSKMLKMRTALAKLKTALGSWTEFAWFENEVAHFLALPVDARRSALPVAGHKPASKIMQVKVYKRSAAVVAEVLLRAGGACESCKSTAPFKRASNGEPYLEVHHIVQLSNDGDDTVANAIAVCPNCHRYHHFG
jgi:5-methylcytosine-specific restriction enzyme A